MAKFKGSTTSMMNNCRTDWQHDSYYNNYEVTRSETPRNIVTGKNGINSSSKILKEYESENSPLSSEWTNRPFRQLLNSSLS